MFNGKKFEELTDLVGPELESMHAIKTMSDLRESHNSDISMLSTDPARKTEMDTVWERASKGLEATRYGQKALHAYVMNNIGGVELDVYVEKCSVGSYFGLFDKKATRITVVPKNVGKEDYIHLQRALYVRKIEKSLRDITPRAWIFRDLNSWPLPEVKLSDDADATSLRLHPADANLSDFLVFSVGRYERDAIGHPAGMVMYGAPKWTRDHNGFSAQRALEDLEALEDWGLTVNYHIEGDQ